MKLSMCRPRDLVISALVSPPEKLFLRGRCTRMFFAVQFLRQEVGGDLAIHPPSNPPDKMWIQLEYEAAFRSRIGLS